MPVFFVVLAYRNVYYTTRRIEELGCGGSLTNPSKNSLKLSNVREAIRSGNVDGLATGFLASVLRRLIVCVRAAYAVRVTNYLSSITKIMARQG